jgi:hypothetical protein
MANRILGQGAAVKTEKISRRSFQRNFGNGTRVRSSGMFIGILRNKLKTADGG